MRRILLDNFGDDVDLWADFQRADCRLCGNAYGFFAPGLKNEKYARQSLHNLLLCHGEAVKLFRTYSFAHAKIGIVVDIWKHYPARPGNKEDEERAIFNNEIAGYGMFLHPLFLGGYSDELSLTLKKMIWFPGWKRAVLMLMHQKLDFYGLNFYNGLYDNMEEIRKREEILKAGGNYQDRPEQHPEALRDVLHMVVEKYHVDIPIYITENGLPQEDGPMEEVLNDQERIDYVRQVLIALYGALEDGIDVRGYYMWSLLDNFEWSCRFLTALWPLLHEL